MTGRLPLKSQPPLPTGIEGLVTLLKQAKFNVDGENLADALWLAQQITPDGSAPTQTTADEGNDQGNQPQVNVRHKANQSQKTDTPPPVSLTLEGKQGQSPRPRQSPQGTVQAPAPPALRETLSLGRAFRPLMRKVASNRTVLLDEEATAERTAEQKLCIPVLKPAPERWLEVALVVEESRSHLLWKDLIADFQRLLERQGAFRDVRVWSLVTNAAGQPELYSQRHIPYHKQRVRSPREILDPSGRRLVILVSDCISPLWQTGQVLELLQLWYRECPLTLLQLLPEKLWERSALGNSFAVELGALSPITVNAQLLTEGLPIWEDIDLAKALKIPVITLAADAILAWARVLAGAGHARTPGVIFDDRALQAWQSTPTPLPQDAATLVKQFQDTASPLARRLAGLMALVPISPPIIYLIQQTCLPDSRPIHVAEIAMSGLLEPLPTGGKQASPRALFQFVDGVRAELRQSVPKSETEAVLDAISQYIAQKAGISIRSFTALLTLPTDQVSGESAEEIEAFARLTRPVLRQLGGRYAALAERLGDDLAPFQLQLPPGWPRIQRCTFETATLVLPSIPLTTFEFETATLEVVENPNLGQRLTTRGRVTIDIIKDRRTQRQWVEPLGDNLTLDMVAIPGGTFLMGSPTDEPKRLGNEGPPQEVTLEPFLMGKYPVTQAQWRFVAGLDPINRELSADPSNFKGDDRPVEQVRWYEAVEFCDRLSRFTGRDYRLPSEAQWEYACRAGTTTPFHFGETITTDLANYNGNYTYGKGPKGRYRKSTTEVVSFPANAFGLYDMHGNVWEWCQDHYHGSYEGAPTDGSPWVDLEAKEDARRVLRGGSWNGVPANCRSARRYFNGPSDRFYNIGFRVLCLAPGL